jgi:RNA polymerase sigma-70 factor (ECF subfamily)
MVGTSGTEERLHGRPCTKRGLRSLAVNPSGYSAEELVELAADGSDVALAELYDRFGRVAYGLAVRVVGDGAAAEDVVRAAFLDVWRGAGRFQRGRGSVASWILVLVHRRAVDVVRERRRHGFTPRLARAHTAEEGGEDALPRVSRARRPEILCGLDAEQREVIELAYYGAFTQSEIAERLGVPLGTVRTRTLTALSRLRQLRSEDGLASAGESRSGRVRKRAS